MEKRRIASGALQALIYFLASTVVATAAPAAAKPPHLTWSDVLRLLVSPSKPIDATTIERVLGVRMARQSTSADEYRAWIEGQEGANGPSSVQLIYMPSRYKGYTGQHEISLQIFVRDIECVSPERMRADLLQAGFVATSPHNPQSTRDSYRLGAHRALRVTYPAGRTGAALQLWAILHHTTAEDRRCVGDVLVTETG